VNSIPDEVIGYFNWPNHSSRTVSLGTMQTQPEMNTRNLARSKGGRIVKLITTPPSVSPPSRNCGILDASQTYRFLRPVTEMVLHFISELKPKGSCD
jgi:hypothetical protein